MPGRDTTPRLPVGHQLRLRTLGDASLDLLSVDGVAAEHQEMSKALALVTYLACAPTRKESREHLVDLLWSDLEVDAGQHALRQHLWLLRRRFGAILAADRQNVARSGAPLDFDRDSLLAAAERGDCERVVDLYRGEFFLGFAAPGSSEFERWADLERARLRSVFVRSAGQLVRNWLSSGRARDGQHLARRIRDAEPLAQHSWRLLIEAHISGGDYLGASVEADAFERLLSQEDIEAESASRSLIAVAQRGSAAPTGAAQAAFSDLVGRETEFGWLMKAWQAASAGRSTLVHIVAPAGFGKTRLLQDFRARLASLRARVVVARADAGSGNIPLSFASDLVAALGSAPGAGGVTPETAAVLVGLAPSLASTYPAVVVPARHADEPHVRRAAIRDLLTAIAEDRPLAVLIDDLHWSDPDSASLLASALGALGAQRLLVVVAQRPTSDLVNIPAEAQQFSLAPLSDSAIAALLANVATLPTAAWSDTLASELRRATGGSPLLVVETLQLAMQRDLLTVTDGAWHCASTRHLADLLRAGGAVRQRVDRLDGSERAIIRLLSIARLPLPIELLSSASQQPTDELSVTLTILERLGLVRHREGIWQLGHDEYASAVLADLPTDETRALHAALGHALIENATPDRRLRRLAPRHLRLGNAWERLHASFMTVVCDSVRHGDRRTHLVMAVEFLGSDASAHDAQRLVSGLPLDVRIGLVTPRRKAAALLGAIAAPAAGLWFALAPATRVRPTAEQVALIGIRDGVGGMVIHEVPFSSNDLQGQGPIVLDQVNRRTVRLRTTYDGLPAPSPTNPNDWLTVHAVSDSGTTDIFLTNSNDGSERRLTSARGDDTEPVWSPDGSEIAFASARWSALGHTSIATMNLRSGAVRRLSTADAKDENPLWSPDGSRIALNRSYINGGRAVCVVAMDATTVTCHEMATTASLIGWLADSILLMDVGVVETHELREFNVRSGVSRPAGTLEHAPAISPDGAWLLCDCRGSGPQSSQPVVIQYGNSTRRRPIALSVPHSTPPNLWWRPPPIAHYIARVALSEGVGDPIVNVPYHLRAAAFGPSGAVRGLPFRSFSVSDSGIASIDSNGVLTGRRLGRVTVHLSAGGWRRDSLVLMIQENRRDTLAAENWKRGIDASWLTFGEPKPFVMIGARGSPRFTTAGDGTFHSGAFSHRAYSQAQGLTMSTTLSFPITLGQWQDLEIGLFGNIDTARVARWDSRGGYLWGEGRMTGALARCALKFPAGAEGPSYAQALLVKGMAQRRTAPPAWLRTGRWTRLTLQLFPDGRCGAALDNQVINVTASHRATPVPVHMVLMGNSYQTQVLVGPLVLTQGVDTTIAWGRSPP